MGAYAIDGAATGFAHHLLGAVLALGVAANFFTNLLISFVYFTALTAFWNGQTLGKRAAGIAVRRLDGGGIGIVRAAWRWAAYFLSLLPGGLGFLTAAFTANSRALHDFVSGTRVVARAELGLLRKTAVVCFPFLAALGYIALMVLPSLARLRAGAPDAAAIGGAMTAQAQKAKADGEVFGRGKSEEACVAEAVSRLNSCADLLCQAEAKVFLASALKSASRRDGFCQDVPQSSAILRTVKWRLSICQSLKTSDIDGCGRVISQLQEHCHQPKTSSAHAKTAEDLFKQAQTLGKNFDPAIVSLYDDSAYIENNRIYPTGQTRKMTMPASQYKAMMAASLPIAKLRGDISTYSEVTFTPENGRVRIRAKRFSELKKYDSPISWLVGKNAEGHWVIYEEISESRP